MSASSRQLNWWVEKGYLFPEEDSRGTGNGGLRFSRHERRVLAIMERLVTAGFLAARAAGLARLAVEGSYLIGAGKVRVPLDENGSLSLVIEDI